MDRLMGRAVVATIATVDTSNPSSLCRNQKSNYLEKIGILGICRCKLSNSINWIVFIIIKIFVITISNKNYYIYKHKTYKKNEINKEKHISTIIIKLFIFHIIVKHRSIKILQYLMNLLNYYYYPPLSLFSSSYIDYIAYTTTYYIDYRIYDINELKYNRYCIYRNYIIRVSAADLYIYGQLPLFLLISYFYLIFLFLSIY